MPLPEPKPFERLDSYLNRCIPVEIEAGKERGQAAAICAANRKKRNNLFNEEIFCDIYMMDHFVVLHLVLTYEHFSNDIKRVKRTCKIALQSCRCGGYYY